MTLVYLFLILSTIMYVAHVCLLLHIAWLRKKGIYPKAGFESLEDVKKLLKANKPTLALRCYRAINPEMSLKAAKAKLWAIRSKIEIDQF